MLETQDVSLIRRNPFRWVMLAFICFFYFFILGFSNQAFNALLATISLDLGWTDVQRTSVATAVPTGMIWFVFFAGVLTDKISVKKLLCSAIAVGGILIALRGQAQGFMFFFMIMFLFGVASAFYLPSCTKVVSLWFDKDELMFANGCLTAASPLGMLVANLFTARIIAAVGGWRMMYMIIGIVSILVVCAFFIVGRERKSEDASLSSNILTTADLGFWKNIKGVMKVPLVWLFAIANMFYLGTLYAAMRWGQFIFQSDPGWGLDLVRSGQIAAFANITSMLAFVLVPMIIAKIGRVHYKKIAIVSGVVSATLMIVGPMSYNFIFICICMVITGFMSGAIVPAPKLMMLNLPEVSGARAGTAMGFFHTVEQIGIAVLTALLGALILIPGTQSGLEFQYAGVVLGVFYSLQYASPVLLIVSIFVIKRLMKQAATVNTQTQ